MITYILIIFAICFILFLRYFRCNKCVGVVVLGDIGRSPRMQYHAISLAKCGYSVIIYAFGGSTPHANLIQNPNISITYLHPIPNFLKRILPFSLFLLVKVIWQSIDLFLMLLIQYKPSTYFLQNPPSVPAIGVCCIMSFLTGFKLIVDWHNYGHSIMALSLHQQHPIVQLYNKFEFFFGKYASKNICVSKMMKEDLKTKYGIEASTLYDMAPDIFQLLPLNEKHALFQKLEFLRLNNLEENVFTEMISGNVSYKQKRPILVISSTSWTADEDFGLLFDAFDEYEKECALKINVFPNIICVITGKGPLKEHYMKQAANRWTYISIYFPWLAAEDYPLLLGSADLGICLHTSSSGLDLPMKVVDMFGCCLPVCALKYSCIDELVQDGKNGMLVSNSKELAATLKELLIDYPDNNKIINKLQLNLIDNTNKRWHANWTDIVLPLLME